MVIIKKFGIAYCSVYHLWERARNMHELGVINSPEFILCRKNSRRRVMYPTEFVWESVMQDVVGGRHFILYSL